MKLSLPIIIVIAAFAAASSQAQPVSGGLPNGGYLQSCESVALQSNGTVLAAQCRSNKGELRSSTLRFRDCQSPIENVDGRLSCAMASVEPYPNPTSAQSLPPGNYANSCRGALTQGFGYSAVLSAQCQTRDGRWRASSLRYADCRSGIENIDGQLTCAVPGTTGGYVDRREAPPPGNYWQTCQNLVINGSGPSATMTAQCQTRDGRTRTSSLNYKTCRTPVENVDGRLSCSNRQPYNGGQGGYGYNQGGYSSGGGYGGSEYGDSITLFDGPNFRGAPFTSDREVTNLPREFNDRAISLRVGRSVWQVCTDSDFRGHCETFDRDVRDLRDYGMERGVSSMRPVQ